METSEVSLHQVRIYLALRAATGWLTSKDVAKVADVSPRTSRAHLLKLVNIGIVDQAEVFPGHRYRLSEVADKRNKNYVQRIEQAISIFGLEVPA